MSIKCPWCQNIYISSGLFNNHFYNEDLEDIHINNTDYTTNKAKQLINKYRTETEKQQNRIQSFKFIREQEQKGNIKQWEIDNILKSLK